MRIAAVLLLASLAVAKDCPIVKKTNSKLFCYYSKLSDVEGCYCSHVVLPPDSDVKSVERVRERSKGLKVLVTVNEFNQGLLDLLKSTKIDGLEIKLQKFDSKNDINDFISTVRSKIGSDLYLAVSVPSDTEIIAKYYDFKGLSKQADVFILQTAFLGASKNVTFHPSRLSGLWDMQNTDSMVDLVSGLGAPLSKLVVTAPVQAYDFTLQNEEYSAPGSPAVELRTITRDELCEQMKNGANWTLERDEDQAGPYIFSKSKWIAFEDSSSVDIKAKYSRVRGLAGLALKDLSLDGGKKCGASILESAYEGLSRRSRAPRGAVLHSLEREIQEGSGTSVSGVQLSPYRITRIIDTEGHWHVVRQDTRTEFTCSRQGYFVHPRSCNRFYRCVKFDQQTDEFSVFEFDCPSGLAFDERVEVCVWPGSLPQGQACSGSSEIAPVPRQRFECPHEPGYYADPENCRWFFACLDHGRSSLEAYEFRCPFGLVFDADRLVCEWPWLVPKCAAGLGLELTGYASPRSSQILTHYDGLGALGTIKLGGVSGTFQQPIVYSNIGGNRFGGIGIQAANSLYNAGLLKSSNLDSGFATNAGYGLNQAGGSYSYVGSNVASRNLGQASFNYNTGHGEGTGVYSTSSVSSGAQSTIGTGVDQRGYVAVSDAGLSGEIASNLNINRVGGAYAAGSLQSGEAGFGATSNSGLNQVSGAYVAISDAGQSGEITSNFDADYGAKSTVAGSVGSYVAANTDSGHDSGTYSNIGTVGVTSGQGVEFGAKANRVGGSYFTINQGSYPTAGISSSRYASNVATGNSVGSNQIQSGSGYLSQSDLTAINSIGNANLNSAEVNSAEFSGNYGAKIDQAQSFQTVSQNLDQNKYQSINIVGGGYSAVGQSSSGVEVSNIGEGNIGYSTTPISISTYASVPTVTSVPIPTISTPTGFDSYNGGVVANVPGLQYRVQGETGVANVSKNFASFIQNNYNTYQSQKSNAFSTAGVAQSYDTNGGYNYDKPRVSFEEGSSIQKEGGYLYPKPSVKFEETPVKTVSYSTPAPFVVQPVVSTVYSWTPVPVTAKPVVNSYSYVHSPTTVYKPVSYSTPASINVYRAPAVSTYSYSGSVSSTERPYTYSTVATPVAQPLVPVQPVLSSQDSGGYVYDKPSVKFEETPVNTQFVVQKQAPAVSTYSYSGSVSSTERPYTYSTVATPVVQPVVPVQPIVPSQDNGGYVYDKPSVKFEETPVNTQYVVQRQAPAVSTYSYSGSVSSTERPYTYSTVATPVVQPVVPVQPIVSSQDNGGYVYDKPSVKFEETPVNTQYFVQKQAPAVSTYSYSSTERPYTYSTIATPVVQPVVPVQPVVSSQDSGGYVYAKPSVKFEETPQFIAQKPAASYSYSIQNTAKQTLLETKPQYIVPSYPTPKPIYLPQPQVYVYTTPAPALPSYNFSQIEYDFTKPAVPVLEKFSIRNPASSYLTYQHQTDSGYHYQKPSLQFNEPVQPEIVSYKVRPAPRPIVSVAYQKPAVVESYFYQSTPKYTYKDVVQTVAQKTIQPVVSTYLPAQVKPVVNTYLPVSTEKPRPAVVSSYSYVQPKYVPTVTQKTVQPVVSTYLPAQVKPVVNTYLPVSTEKPRPAVVSSYSYVQPEYVVPTVTQKTLQPVVSTYLPATVKPVVSTYYLPVTEKPRPAVVSSYSYVAPKYTYKDVVQTVTQKTVQPVVSTYLPVKPVVNTYLPVTEKPVVISSYSYVAPTTPRPVSVVNTYLPVTEKPKQVLYNYVAPTKPAVVSSYSYVAPKVPTTPRPYVAPVASYNYVASSTPKVETYGVKTGYSYPSAVPNVEYKGYDYPKPSVTFVEEPRPVVTTYEERQPVQEVPFVKKTAYVTGQRSDYVAPARTVFVENYRAQGYAQSTYSSTPKYVSSTPRPTFLSTIATTVGGDVESPGRFYYYDSRLTSTPTAVYEEQPIVTSTYLPPRAKPVVTSTYLPPRVVTSTYLPPRARPTITSTYLPPTREYLPVTTARPVQYPTEEYYVSTASPVNRIRSRVKVTTPSNEYLPVRSKVRYSTTTPEPVVEYLPVKITTAVPVVPTTLSRDYLPVKVSTEGIEVGTRRPAKVVKVIRPVKTIIKQNDFLPMLSTKLGAQCTCASSNLRLRKKQKVIIVEDEDEEEDDGYAVDDQGTIVENYSFEPEKVIDVTPVSVVSTIKPQRARVSVTQPVEIFLREDVTPAPRTYSKQVTQEPSDKELADVVRTGLKLVKQAAKEGAREGTEEAIARVRETIECQRAGLFRHPNKCNKFYSCRWDCKKNKYVLHTFNCPVHLTFDSNLGACNWPSQGPACADNTLLPAA